MDAFRRIRSFTAYAELWFRVALGSHIRPTPIAFPTFDCHKATGNDGQCNLRNDLTADQVATIRGFALRPAKYLSSRRTSESSRPWPVYDGLRVLTTSS